MAVHFVQYKSASNNWRERKRARMESITVISDNNGDSFWRAVTIKNKGFPIDCHVTYSIHLAFIKWPFKIT